MAYLVLTSIDLGEMKALYTLATAHRGITARIIEKDIPGALVRLKNIQTTKSPSLSFPV
jgi:hypothetical protein